MCMYVCMCVWRPVEDTGTSPTAPTTRMRPGHRPAHPYPHAHPPSRFLPPLSPPPHPACCLLPPACCRLPADVGFIQMLKSFTPVVVMFFLFLFNIEVRAPLPPPPSPTPPKACPSPSPTRNCPSLTTAHPSPSPHPHPSRPHLPACLLACQVPTKAVTAAILIISFGTAMTCSFTPNASLAGLAVMLLSEGARRGRERDLGESGARVGAFFSCL